MTSRARFCLVFCGLAPLFGVVSAAVPGCGETTTIYPCVNPIFGRKDHTGRADECCDTDCCEGVISTYPDQTPTCTWQDAGTSDAQADADGGPPADDAGTDSGSDAQADAALACPGACIGAPPLGWSDPTLLWRGAMGSTLPACPEAAPVVGFAGFADLDAPPASCGVCSCEAATATCGLLTSIAAHSRKCNPGGGVVTSFDPPVSWDGSCTNSNAVAQAQDCGGDWCATSLIAGTLTVESETCAVVTTPPALPSPPPVWATAVLACKRGSSIACDDPTQTCAPVATAPPGFELCVYQDGDLACPASFPDKHSVAVGIDDQRACSACACGAPAGGFCSASLTVFTDDACTTKFFSFTIGSTSAPCLDITAPPSGPPALGSKSVDELKYLPGTCGAAGGEATGQATPTGTATFCCVP